MENTAHKIRHYNIRHLMERGFSLAESSKGYNEYLAFWWDQIPLGHCWVQAGNITDTKDLLLPQQIWPVISETLEFYCSQKPEMDFIRLASFWENRKADCFQKDLDHLFLPYSTPSKDFSSDMTLIICTRNRPRQLRDSLDSLASLSWQPKEIIVVDNAPENDNTKDLVKGYPDIRYVQEPQRGLDNARNAGWKQATSALVAYIDDDVTLHKDWVWQIERAFDNQRVMAVTGILFAAELETKAQVIFEEYWSFNRGYCDIYYDTDYFKAYLKKGVPAWDVGAGANMAFRRLAFQAAGGFDTRLDAGASGCNGDSEMWYRLMAYGWTIHYTPRAVAYHTHRKEKKELKRQIYFYLRGAASSLLVQYQRHGHKGNLYHLFATLPAFYIRSCFLRLRYPHAMRYDTLLQEMRGWAAGIIYFYKHKKYKDEAISDVFSNNVLYGDEYQDPLVSVIITTYNHGKYLPDAIESILAQTYPRIELIIVDDGSTDNTSAIVQSYPDVIYINQSNKGLAAARNTGIFNSKGSYLVFVDADDMLYPYAISKNLGYFRQNFNCVFVSGWHDRVDENKKLIETYESTAPEKEHYNALLRGNYIGMHGAVMYKREIFNTLLFDELLRVCEDYDLYLRIAKKYPVFSHNEKLAAYRIHANNMSGNIRPMLRQAKAVLRKNADLSDEKVKKNYKEGKKNWDNYYTREMYRRIVYRYLYPGYVLNMKDLFFVTIKMPVRMMEFFLHKSIYMFSKKHTMIKKPGNIKWGDLRRAVPLSKEFGYDRGGPVDRYYIENFLKENAAYIKGNVLEIGDNTYTMIYGGGRVTGSDILFIDGRNPKATIMGDLSTADHIPSDKFDCIILTQTLHLIYDFRGAIKHCHRILKPGGVLLLTVPGITQIDYGEWGDTWYWSFTGKAIQKLLWEYFHPEDVLVQTHGNVLAAAAFLYGMGKEEISDSEKNEHDPHYQVIITAIAAK